jgi:hypothetical protein
MKQESHELNRARLAFVVVLAFGIAACHSRDGQPEVPAATTVTPAPAPAATTPVATAPEPAKPTANGFEKLVARWLREDGGYILEIRTVSPKGAVDAAYYNPRPINVAKAEAFSENGALTLFVELRAPNYPGSTYRLVYDPASDTLVGTYFQALQKQTFDVSFVRR